LARPAYAERAVRFMVVEGVETFIAKANIALVAMPQSALSLAGKVFQRYRAAGGPRSGVLADFFIGAHAAVMGLRLLSRDAKSYRRYFPKLDLLTA
jgi:predicted nucleic acid-binding protein